MDADIYENTQENVESSIANGEFAGSKFEAHVACELDEDDMQCGYIFFSEKSRILKFFCTYCRETYDNINYYCEHLGEHINETNDEDNDVIEDADTTTDSKLGMVEYYGDEYDEQISDVKQDFVQTTNLNSHTQHNVQLHNGQEQLQASYETVDNTFCATDLFSYAAETTTETSNNNTTATSTPIILKPSHTVTASNDSDGTPITDFECMIDATTNSEHTAKLMGTPLVLKKKKKKKVTTVKVIAIKNRIAELYERIKTEEEKRSRLLDTVDAGDISSCDKVANNTSDNDDSVEQQPTADAITPANTVHRKIIGETLITLLPNDKGAAWNTTPTAAPPPVAKPASTFSESVKQHRRDCVCPACGLSFRSSFGLSIHKRTHYLESSSNIKLVHKCSDCDQLFNKITELKEHLQMVHYPEGFICKICGKKLTSLTLLEKHMRAVHLNRPFSCKICQKSFDSRSGFEAHVDTHIEGQTNYKCRVCGRKYSTESALNHHLRNHKEQKPQCCVVCGKMTLRITQHMKIHTPRPKRVLSCTVCGKVFNFSSGLSHHFKIMHKLPRPSSKSKREREHEDLPLRRKRKTRSFTSHEEDGDFDVDAETNKTDRGTNSKRKSQSFSERREQEEQEEKEKQQQQQSMQLFDEEVHAKEEEAKRVIVELIQNASSTYATVAFLSDVHDHINEFEVTAPPPIAREETISAVNSIVNDC